MPDQPFDPEGNLPEELRRMLEQLGGQLPVPLGAFSQGTGAPTGPVEWRLARQVALRALTSDRAPSDAERERFAQALHLAELWLDASSLPASPDAGRLQVAGRAEWIDRALEAMRPLVEPVAAASTANLSGLLSSELGEVDLGAELERLGLGELAGMLAGVDPSAMLQPVAATMAGLQAGQVLAELAEGLLIGTELGIPTAGRSLAVVVAPNVADAFAGYDLDPTEVAVALALHEAATRRLFHAVGWLEGHVHDLVATFAEQAEVDVEQLRDVAQDVMGGVDPSDPEALEAAMRSAASFRLEPTDAQRRTLERLQGVVALVAAWVRAEVAAAARGRLPSIDAVEEILRRRRATRGTGEHLLAALLGLDLTPDDPGLGERFVSEILAARGEEGLREAVAHPENLPDLTELAAPERWLLRTSDASPIPDDLSDLEGLGTGPVEESADERVEQVRRDRGEEGRDDGGDDPTDDPTADDGADEEGDDVGEGPGGDG